MNKLRSIQISQPCTGEEEWQALKEPLMSGWITQGPKVAAFEQAFASRHHVRYGLAASSCTTALHLILASLEIGPGDEVIVPAFTWVATSNAVLYCGAKPVFVDIDPHTFNLDPKSLSAAITPKTRAIIPVHLFGLCADMNAIAEAAQGIPLVEDAACATGSTYKGRPAGGLGTAAAFSFHPRKSITTGEGGMVTTNDKALAECVAKLRNHGAEISEEQRHQGPQPYLLPDFNLLGFNYRMTDLQGAVGLVQLEKLDTMIQDRARWAAYYIEELRAIPWLEPPRIPADCGHAWQSFICTVNETHAPFSRNELMAKLQERGISTRPGTQCVPDLGYYRNQLHFNPEDYPNALRCAQQTLALPLHNRMQAGDFGYIVETLTKLSNGAD
ncbi:MAG: DegT/DnrJ/EryC1/StrS family aminotransferase [Candidatus Omnitrophica bacterium]|nr:DegT/DnrJ/EryC1/StrS family aminotransferase [Candidatus Omnitrophota bacterium]